MLLVDSVTSEAPTSSERCQWKTILSKKLEPPGPATWPNCCREAQGSSIPAAGGWKGSKSAVKSAVITLSASGTVTPSGPEGRHFPTELRLHWKSKCSELQPSPTSSCANTCQNGHNDDSRSTTQAVPETEPRDHEDALPVRGRCQPASMLRVGGRWQCQQ